MDKKIKVYTQAGVRVDPATKDLRFVCLTDGFSMVIDLPTAMTRGAALKHLLTHKLFKDERLAKVLQAEAADRAEREANQPVRVPGRGPGRPSLRTEPKAIVAVVPAKAAKAAGKKATTKATVAAKLAASRAKKGKKAPTVSLTATELVTAIAVSEPVVETPVVETPVVEAAAAE